MTTTPERFDECRGFEERRAWLTRENKRRCEEAMARIKTDPAADLSDLTFLCDPGAVEITPEIEAAARKLDAVR